MDADQEVNEFLEHVGVKGMHWGQRHAQNRALNRVSREKDKAQKAKDFIEVRKQLRPKQSTKNFDLSTKEGRKASRAARAENIQRARDRINTGAARADKKEAKAQYKKDKIEKGSREARKILNAKKNELASDWVTSRQAKDGFELAGMIIDKLNRDLQASRN